MSAPPPALPASFSTSGYEDGLGRRSLAFDRESGSVLERLVVRPELAAFERALRERADRLAVFDDERVARVREISRDRQTGALTVVSEFVAGHRLSGLLDDVNERGRDENAAPSVDVALGFLLQILPALGALHATTGGTHGAVGDGRSVITPAGQLVLLDAIYGPSLERLQFSRRRLWTELRIAVPPSAGPCRFDTVADLAQAAVIAIAITVGRPLTDRDYPDGLHALMDEAVEIAQLRGRPRFAAALQRFFERALPFPARRVYETADDACAAVEDLVAAEMGAERCRAALTDLARDPTCIQPPVAVPGVDTAIDAPASGPDSPTAVDAPVAISALPDPEPASNASEPAGESAPIEEEPIVDQPSGPADPVALPPSYQDPGDTVAAAALEPAAPILPQASDPEPEAVVAATAPEAPTPVTPLQGPAEAAVAVVPEPAASILPEPSTPEPADDVAAAAPEPATPVTPQTSRRKRNRGPRARRDRLRSAEASATPVQVAHEEPPLRMPVIPSPPPPAPAAIRAPEPLWVPPANVSIAPVAAPSARTPQLTTGVRIRTDAPAGYTPPASMRVRDSRADDVVPYGRPFAGPTPHQPSNTWWKLATAAAIAIAAGVVVGGGNLLDRLPRATGPASLTAAVAVEAPAAPTGSIAVETEPAGARVLIDGKAAGETPLKVDGVATGSHIVTLITPGTTLKRSVKVEAGRTASVDVPVYSGWLAVFAPIVLDLAEHGQPIGSTEQGRLMLPPGRHTLTFSNRSLGYSAVRKVDIEAGEEKALTMDPRGTINVNAVPWAEVYIDGERVGETPLANFDVRLGTREILFRHPLFGERRVTTVVTATAPAAASVDFTKSN